MIAYLKGVILHRDPGRVLISAGAIGYQVSLDMLTETKIAATGEIQELFIYHLIREQEQTLYGFDSMLKRELFEVLMQANKVGPKVALSFLGSQEPKAIIQAILNKDIKAFGKVSGAGPKILTQVVLDCELKARRLNDKFRLGIQAEVMAAAVLVKSEPKTPQDEVAQALGRLGFTGAEIAACLKEQEARLKGLSLSDQVSLCLRTFYSR